MRKERNDVVGLSRWMADIVSDRRCGLLVGLSPGRLVQGVFFEFCFIFICSKLNFVVSQATPSPPPLPRVATLLKRKMRRLLGSSKRRRAQSTSVVDGQVTSGRKENLGDIASSTNSLLYSSTSS